MQLPTPTLTHSGHEHSPPTAASTAEREEGEGQLWRAGGRFKHPPGRQKLKGIKSIIANFARLTQGGKKKLAQNSTAFLPQPLHMNAGVSFRPHVWIWVKSGHTRCISKVLPEGS